MEAKRIKFIWDFRGEFSEETAKHHAIHLNEFCESNSLQNYDTGFEPTTEFHTIAYLTCSIEYLELIKGILRPHRAVVAE